MYDYFVGNCFGHSNKKYTPEIFKPLFYIRYQTPSFCFFICAFLLRINLFNLCIRSASNCVMKFWSKANIFILVQYYFPTNSSELVSGSGTQKINVLQLDKTHAICAALGRDFASSPHAFLISVRNSTGVFSNTGRTSVRI